MVTLENSGMLRVQTAKLGSNEDKKVNFGVQNKVLCAHLMQ